MKTILTIFFLATLSTAATAAPKAESPMEVQALFSGELCGPPTKDLTAFYQDYDVGVKAGAIGAITIQILGEIAETGAGLEGRTQQCEVTLDVKYPKGFRFSFLRAPDTFGHLDAKPDVALDVEFEVSSGMAQYHSYKRTLEGVQGDAVVFDSDHAGNSLLREFRSSCSGSAEFVLTNTATIRATELRGPGEIDDIGMAFVDLNSLDIVWERCAPGEL